MTLADGSILRNLSTYVGDVLGSGVDGRLAIQYSLAILCAQKVRMLNDIVHTDPSH